MTDSICLYLSTIGWHSFAIRRPDGKWQCQGCDATSDEMKKIKVIYPKGKR